MSDSFLTFRCGPYRFAIESTDVLHVTDSASGDRLGSHMLEQSSHEVDLNEMINTGETSSASLFLQEQEGRVIRIAVTEVEGLETLRPDAFVNLPLFNQLLSQLVAGVCSDGEDKMLFRLNPPSLWLESL